LAIHCFRLASLAENTTAQRSVVYLTLIARRSVDYLTITNTHINRHILTVACYHRNITRMRLRQKAGNRLLGGCLPSLILCSKSFGCISATNNHNAENNN
ncbi:MAG: hypothetical protein LBQ66_01105, partial [Planctomycetaceae bacterium]|nr:hypothetical protein [Planctomycetaceae bacterium]